MSETIISQTVTIATAGRVFRYVAARITPRCYAFSNPETGAVVQFTSAAAMWAWVAGLQAHLARKYGNPQLPAPQVAGLLPARCPVPSASVTRRYVLVRPVAPVPGLPGVIFGQPV